MDNFIKQKRDVKKLFSEKLSFNYSEPLIAVILDKELPKNDLKMLRDLLAGVVNLEAKVIILSENNPSAEFKDSAIVLPYSRRNRKYLLEAADIALCLDFNDAEEMLLNGVIPVSTSRRELSDYNPNHETGNAFIYNKNNSWSIFAAMVRAVETFKFPYDWKGIVRQGLESVECKV